MRPFLGIWVVVGISLGFHLSVIAQAPAHQSDLLFEHFDTNDGLPSNFANAVVQDSIGFLWFLHDNALSRYDGYTFKTYPHDSTDYMRAMGNTRNGMLILDQSRNVWVVNQQVEKSKNQLTLKKYNPKTDSFINHSPETNGMEIGHICFDKTSPTIWMGTGNGHGLFSYNTTTKKILHFTNGPKERKDGSNNFIFLQDQDSIILLASFKGLWTFNKETKIFRRPACSPQDTSLLYHHPTVFILPSKNEPGYLWIVMIGPQHRLVKIDKNYSVVHLETHAPLDGEVITIDDQGALWFTTHTNGLYKYDPDDSLMTKIEGVSGNQNRLRSEFLRGLTIDRDGNIWVTTNDRGITKLKKQRPAFNNYAFKGEVTARAIFQNAGQDHLILARNIPQQRGLNEIIIAPIIQDRLDSNTFKRIAVRMSHPLAEGRPRINQLWLGRRNLWMGTWNHGIYGIPIHMQTKVIQPEPLQRFQPDTANPHTINTWFTTGLMEDASDNLWVGTFGIGLNKIDLSKQYGKPGSVLRYRHDSNDPASISSDMVWWGMHPKDEEAFWLITGAGVDLFSDGSFQKYFKRDNILCITRDSRGALLVGTTQGFYDTGAGKSRDSVLLQKLRISGLLEDHSGRLWINSHHGVVCYDRDEKNEIILTESDGLQYSRDWMDKSSKGIFVTSDQHGVTIFDPSSLGIKKEIPSVVLTNLLVNNKVPVIGQTAQRGSGMTIPKAISMLEQVVVNYQFSDFSITFSAMEMTAPLKNIYRYKLEGYDDDWTETDAKSRTATYTNLDPGEYIFKVKSSNLHGKWGENERALAITILPPPWKTWWAYTIYGFLFVGLFLYWRSYEIKRIRLKHQAEHLKEVDELKTRFFANISHEFRTPITLILGPLKDLCSGTLNGNQKPVFDTMLRNGQRLLTLINQLLDLSKIEAGKMALRSRPVELVQFLKEIGASYESLAERKRIEYAFTSPVDQLTVFIDREKMEKVMHNLLANAFKFTNVGHVSVFLNPLDAHRVVIIVKDTGIGIPPDQLDKVFDRFYQVDNSQTRPYEGSGLGMALARELVELHHGKITVESTAGIGTVFRVTIPYGKEDTRSQAINVEEIAAPAGQIGEVAPVVEGAYHPNRENRKKPDEQAPLLLIVEDNGDMRSYLCSTLSHQYKIIEAANGRQGLSKAKELMPDLIISDIMMPEMDGYGLCELLKTNELTSHIPVILLTAKADRESKLAGLETGADDYLAKPFDSDELKLIVRNRIAERRKMRERFSREITLEPKQIAISSMDEKFLRKVLDIIETNIDNESFSIEEFGEAAGYSHVHFYRKIKALSGESPNQFLRTIRLKRAAELLRHKSDNVSQIAYSVGFSSQSYFIKCFKEQFGITPGQFVERSSRTNTPS